jgi:hypothetical protein
MAEPANGMIWLSTPRYTVGLIVRNGVVTETPPIARRWAYGRAAPQVWEAAKARGATLKWLGDREHG